MFIVLGIFLSQEMQGQTIDRSLVIDDLTENIPHEKIYVDYNTSLLFPGEYLLYSVYNVEEDNGEVSNFSKIAYVEMIGKDDSVIFKQKIELKNGRGSADFFVPTNTPSGSYKLIAYTNWMKNFKNAFFEGDLVVINPYQGDQKKLFQDTEVAKEIDLSTGVALKKGRREPREQKDFLDLELSKKSFGKREQVQITIQGMEPDAAAGNYSLSVRKIGGLPAPVEVEPSQVLTKQENSSKDSGSPMLFLPELRGQIVSGRVFSGESEVSPGNRRVALSIPSYEGFAQFAITKENGQFFFNLDSGLRDESAVIEIVGNVQGNFQIQLDEEEGITTKDLKFIDYTINSEMEQEIIQRSLYNQIENAYFSLKPDTLVSVQEEIIFPKSLVETYNLDDYTRFEGVQETFLEIIKSARVIKEKDNTYVFEVRGLLGHLNMGVRPLVMVDGILVQDHSSLVNLDSNRIQTIKIIRDKIYLGPEIYQGAILVETINGDFPDFHTAPYAENVELVQPEIPKRYFKQVYNAENKNNRIPDYRYQLLWQPMVNVEENGGKIEFFTSDVDGDFEVVLEGFTPSGKPVLIRKTFTVE